MQSALKHYPPRALLLLSFPFGKSSLVTSMISQKKPHQSGASRLIRDCLLGVSNAPILKCWMDISSDCFTAGVVVLVSVGELNALLGWSVLSGTVGVASVKKSCHDEFLEEIQVPVPWPGLTAPCGCKVNVGSSCYRILIAHPSALLMFSLLQNSCFRTIQLRFGPGFDLQATLNADQIRLTRLVVSCSFPGFSTWRNLGIAECQGNTEIDHPWSSECMS